MSAGDRLRVTPPEFMHKVRPILSSEYGFTPHMLGQFEAAFHSSLMGDPNHPSWKAGIDEKTLNQTMQYMKAHPGVTGIGPHHWDAAEKVLKSYIDKRE